MTADGGHDCHSRCGQNISFDEGERPAECRQLIRQQRLTCDYFGIYGNAMPMECQRLQREVAQVPLVDPLFDDLQRGGFLADKQDGLPVSQTFGNDVGDRQALACSRWTVEDKTGSRLDRENRFEVAGIARQDGRQLRGMDLRVESRLSGPA